MSTYGQVLQVVAAYWPTPTWPAESQALFLEAIQGRDPGSLIAAARLLYMTSPTGYRPTVGQLVAISMPVGAAERAFDSLRRAIDHYASKPADSIPDMPRFADPRVEPTVIAIGGWRQFLGGIKVDDIESLRRRFLRAYAEVRIGAAAQLDFRAHPELL